jgi:hypothetical protein
MVKIDGDVALCHLYLRSPEWLWSFYFFAITKALLTIRIRDEQPRSYFLELRNHFFAFLKVKILKFFEDPGSGMETVRIRDLGSGIEKSRIRDPG